jgi:hypothetical protein
MPNPLYVLNQFPAVVTKSISHGGTTRTNSAIIHTKGDGNLRPLAAD